MIKQSYNLKVNLTLEDGKRDFKLLKQALGTKIRLLMINALVSLRGSNEKGLAFNFSLTRNQRLLTPPSYSFSSGCIR